ncbi:hypothetical protein CIG11343_0523 [Campylobacter iguaniorum]|nr:hypothetical protein [Campylobacter iguaniorum]ANE35597.1 hypothetical protein CIG11343_0523 [Campylobacter iguaniorum]
MSNIDFADIQAMSEKNIQAILDFIVYQGSFAQALSKCIQFDKQQIV